MTKQHDTPERMAAVKRATYERLSGKKPTEYEHEVLLDPQLADDVDRLTAEHDLAEREDRMARGNPMATALERTEAASKLSRLAKELEDAKAAAKEQTVTILFRQLPRLEYRDLIEAHEPTEKQRQKNLAWNEDTFAPALISACAVEPELSEDEVKALLKTWNSADANALFNAALMVNVARKTVDLGKDSAGTPSSTESLPSATDGASPTASSSEDPSPKLESLSG